MRATQYFTATAAIAICVVLGAGLQASAQIKIGSVLSVTGPASFLGDPEKKTLEIYVDEINAKGGVNGQKLQLIIYDDAGNANNARTFATRLVEEDKVVAMVGGSTTGSTLAMIPVFEDANIPFISLAGAIQIVEPVHKWVFKTPHTDKMACEKIFADLKQPQSDDDRVDLGHGRIRQVDARPVRGRRAQGGNQNRCRGELWTARQRHDTAAHQYSQQSGRAGGGQSGLWSRPGDRDAQLSPARNQAAAVRESRRCLQAVYRARRSRSRRRAVAGGGACSLPTSSQPTIRRSLSW